MAFGELTSEEFEDRYDFPRPKRNLMGSPIILTCRSGVRASKAAETLQTLGFNAAIYKGSMLDWTEKGGKVLEL
jgi:rhodanese-related sulfurtransferase